MNFYRRFRDAMVSVVLLAVPFFFLNTNLKRPSELNAFDRVILRVSAPLQYIASRLAQGASGLLEDYVLLVDVKADNDRLRHDNERVRRLLAKSNQAEQENNRLRRLLGLRDQLKRETVSAQVIGRETSDFFRVARIRLDRGDRDLVRQGMPVISSDGLVGYVSRAFGQYSDVMLTTDRRSAVDVVVQRSGARGMLRGLGDEGAYRCRLEYGGLEVDVKLGDYIHTSGYGQRYPEGLLVGRITKLKRPLGAYQEAEVTPAVLFTSLREVLVLTNNPTETLRDGATK